MALRPNGIVGRPLREWRVKVARQKELARVWPVLITTDDEFVGSTASSPPDEDAPVVVVYSDYACRYCRELFTIVDTSSVLSDVRILVRHLPLNPTSSVASAELAVCASHLHVFPEVNRRLMSQDSWVSLSEPVLIAQSIGLEPTQGILDCLSSDYPGEVLSRESDLREGLGIRVTPTAVGRSRVLRGMPTVAELDSLARGL